MYHPNVDENSGSICLDVINQTWSPMFDLINIFDEFLPQLLLYPNPSDPLNGEAAKLLQSDPEKYNKKIKDYVKRFASEDIIIDKEKHNKNNTKNENNNTETNGNNCKKEDEKKIEKKDENEKKESNNDNDNNNDSDNDNNENNYKIITKFFYK